MKNKYQYFFVRLLVFTVILVILSVILWNIVPQGTIPGTLPYLFILFFGVTALTHFILLRLTRLSPMKFVSYYMLSTFIRLLLYVVAVLIYVLVIKVNLLPFIISFFLLYIFYTVFEVVHFISQTKE